MKVEVDQLIRSKRRTISLQIKTDGSLWVRAPMRVDTKHVNDFIKQKNNWIITKQFEMKTRFDERRKMLAEREFADKEGILFLGERLLIEIKKSELISWYKREALKHLTSRLDYYTKKFGLKYNSIKITSAKKRWGSCSSRGNINFSWRLIMAPHEVVDYVIVHEASHLVHKNHSRKFWNHVEMMMPDYKKHHVWLKKSGFLLDLQSL